MSEWTPQTAAVHAERRAANARRMRSIDELLDRIRSALSEAAVEPAESCLLRAACQVLAGVVARTPGAEVSISVGPRHRTALLLSRTDDGAVDAHLRRPTADDPEGTGLLEIDPGPPAPAQTPWWAAEEDHRRTDRSSG